MKATHLQSRHRSQAGLNIFELLCFMLILSGAIAGCAFGYGRFGLLGAVLGIPLGGGGGFLAWGVVAVILGVIFCIATGTPFFPPKRNQPSEPSNHSSTSNDNDRNA